MSSTALALRAESAPRSWENAEFPIVCEKCLGDNPYLRMEVDKFGGTCKMCDRPYSVFKWRPGRGQPYRKTEVCQACARIKNLCQTCILDMQLGLPSQLRDAVLHHTEGLVSAESEKNKDYRVQQQLALLEDSGEMMLGEVENEKLLQVARTAAQNREQPRVKLVQGKPAVQDIAKPQLKRKADAIEAGPIAPPPPPGVTDFQTLAANANLDRLPDNMKSFLSQFAAAQKEQGGVTENQPEENTIPSSSAAEGGGAQGKGKAPKKAKFTPKPPSGPPPDSALPK